MQYHLTRNEPINTVQTVHEEWNPLLVHADSGEDKVPRKKLTIRSSKRFCNKRGKMDLNWHLYSPKSSKEKYDSHSETESEDDWQTIEKLAPLPLL